MKKLALLLAVLMLVSAMFVACSKKNTDDDEGDDKTKDPVVDNNNDETTDEEGTEEGTEDGTTEYVEPTSFTFTECAETPVYTIKAVNLREEPSLKDDVNKVSVVADTELVKIAESNETATNKDGEYRWFKVKYDDKEWYVVSIYLTTLSNPDDGFTEVEKTLYLAADSLSVRQYPTTENPAVGYLYKGDTIKVIMENAEEGWYKIEFEGKWTPKGEYYIVSTAKYFSETPVQTDDEAAG